MQRKTGVATGEERVSLVVRKAMLQLEDREELPEDRGGCYLHALEMGRTRETVHGGR